ncbi:MAG: serine/threonine protein kinase [Lachnospiraceae bacterium]|nr:serine/threonine protein kinase [Lachnospiraceae bacterium]
MQRQLEIITTVSDHERSKVFLAIDETGRPVIYKKILGESAFSLIERISHLDSPYFPRIIDCSVTDGYTCVTEEFIEGKELALILRENGLTESDAISIMKQLLEALDVLHRLDPPLIHRDIKPENILITEDKQLKLLDFDAAREYRRDSKSSDTVLLGTRGYAAPEQFGYSQTDIRSDLYSAGVVCTQICEEVKLSETQKSLLKIFTDKATMFDPDERYQSAEEMLTALQSAYNDKSFSAYNAPVKPNTVANQRKKMTVHQRMVIFIGTAIVILLLAGSALLYARSGTSRVFYNMDVIPDEYVFKGIGARVRSVSESLGTVNYPELIIGNDAVSTEPPVLVFSQSNPQAILFYAYDLEGMFADIKLERYSRTQDAIEDRLKISSSDDVIIENGFLCMTVELLTRLRSGTYRLIIDTSHEVRWVYRLLILGDGTTPDDAGAELFIPVSVQYYSSSIRNNVFFSVYNTDSAIRSIYRNDEPVSRNEWIAAKDGHGVLLLESFFDGTGSNNKPISVTIETKNGKKASATIIPVP